MRHNGVKHSLVIWLHAGIYNQTNPPIFDIDSEGDKVQSMKLTIDNKGVTVNVNKDGSLVLSALKVMLAVTGNVTVKRTRKGYKVELLAEELEMADPSMTVA